MKRRSIPTSKICLEDIKLTEHFDVLFMNVAREITKAANELIHEGATSVKVDYFNILDKEENPRGTIGQFHVLGVRP